MDAAPVEEIAELPKKAIVHVMVLCASSVSKLERDEQSYTFVVNGLIYNGQVQNGVLIGMKYMDKFESWCRAHYLDENVYTFGVSNKFRPSGVGIDIDGRVLVMFTER